MAISHKHIWCLDILKWGPIITTGSIKVSPLLANIIDILPPFFFSFCSRPSQQGLILHKAPWFHGWGGGDVNTNPSAFPPWSLLHAWLVLQGAPQRYKRPPASQPLLRVLCAPQHEPMSRVYQKPLMLLGVIMPAHWAAIYGGLWCEWMAACIWKVEMRLVHLNAFWDLLKRQVEGEIMFTYLHLAGL